MLHDSQAGGRKPNARAASAGAARGVIHIPSEDTQRAWLIALGNVRRGGMKWGISPIPPIDVQQHHQRDTDRN